MAPLPENLAAVDEKLIGIAAICSGHENVLSRRFRQIIGGVTNALFGLLTGYCEVSVTPGGNVADLCDGGCAAEVGIVESLDLDAGLAEPLVPKGIGG